MRYALMLAWLSPPPAVRKSRPPNWYMNVGSSDHGPERHRASTPIVGRSAAAAVVLPPRMCESVTVRRALPLVEPSAWKYEYSGLMSRPLNTVNSGLTMSAQSLPRVAPTYFPWPEAVVSFSTLTYAR